MATMEELLRKKGELRSQLRDVNSQIENFELDEMDYEEQYDEMLDEQGEIKVAGLYYMPSQILKAVDDIAYREGLADYMDGLDKEDDPTYQDLITDREEIEGELEGVEEELEALQEE